MDGSRGCSCEPCRTPQRRSETTINRGRERIQASGRSWTLPVPYLPIRASAPPTILPLTRPTGTPTIAPPDTDGIIPRDHEGKGAPDAWRSPPRVSRSAYVDRSPGAGPFPAEAATPHAHLSLRKGQAFMRALGTKRPLACDPRRRAAERWFIGPKRTSRSRYQGKSA
jgi:hypothetical protein